LAGCSGMRARRRNDAVRKSGRGIQTSGPDRRGSACFPV
jgi:hypothetical protein